MDLLQSKEYLPLLKDPGLLRERILNQKKEWIIIDEIQKLPILLDEVHSLMNDYKDQFSFALTGSSARKLKRTQANLLAGRAQTHHMFPITLREIDRFDDIDSYLHYGTLPEVLTMKETEDKIEFLESYAQTYLREEIQQETQVRDLLGFSRFLDIAALMNAQQLNLSNMAREVGLARSTVQGHFSILIDTLLGHLLEPFRPRVKVREVLTPKFYFFDPGLVNALSGKLRDPLESREKGYLFENLVLNELMAFNSYERLGGKFYYWRTPSGNEVDFLFKRGHKAIGFEIKSTSKWNSSFNQGLMTLLEGKKIQKAYGIYQGEQKISQGQIQVLPLKDFVRELESIFEI